MASATPDLRLPSRPQSITALWPVPNCTAWWRRHMGVSNLPTQSCCLEVHRPGVEPATSWSRVWHANHYTTKLSTFDAQLVLSDSVQCDILCLAYITSSSSICALFHTVIIYVQLDWCDIYTCSDCGCCFNLQHFLMHILVFSGFCITLADPRMGGPGHPHWSKVGTGLGCEQSASDMGECII